jgi:hypothetical protein
MHLIKIATNRIEFLNIRISLVERNHADV